MKQLLSFVVLFGFVITAHAEEYTYNEHVRPILEENCFKCHGPKKQKGDMRLDTLSSDFINNPANAETWHDVLGMLNRGEMPPEDEEELDGSKRRTLVAWLTKEIDRALKASRSTGGRVVIRRLNRTEYNNTMRDLLGLDIDYARNLPPEAMSPEGFKNNGASLSMSSMELEYMLKAARDALSRVLVIGSQPQVFHYYTEKSDTDKNKKDASNRLGRHGRFMANVIEFPHEGEFEIKVRARAEIPKQSAFPQMQVRLGYWVGGQRPSRDVAIVDDYSKVVDAAGVVVGDGAFGFVVDGAEVGS